LLSFKIHIAFIGIVLVLTSALSPLFAILHYQTNKKFYVKHCENKASSHCEGKCQLKKKVQKTIANDKEESRPSMSHPVYIPLISTPDLAMLIQVEFKDLTLQLGHYIGVCSSKLVIDYWQPPRRLV
jgi:hypothetical protein